MNDIIFTNPQNFKDSKKLVNYIMGDKILHINLMLTDTKIHQRILDFISGAIYIKSAQLLNPAENVYVSIPTNVTFTFNEKNIDKANKNSMFDLRYDEEEEIKPLFKN